MICFNLGKGEEGGGLELLVKPFPPIIVHRRCNEVSSGGRGGFAGCRGIEYCE
jgi:hypothetical protein